MYCIIFLSFFFDIIVFLFLIDNIDNNNYNVNIDNIDDKSDERK